ncbi:ATP-dependent helicase/DNAse subunit B [Clostridium beijerinckii]|nr:ATP-dependent helicase/DNAse subunit B [Clostridium beijerinckii]NRZ99654.1 ATP-dependent helicase/DNAse subunit B [Clostridium beijerinckii]
MSIRFVYGRSGTGKSKFCINDIKIILIKNWI